MNLGRGCGNRKTKDFDSSLVEDPDRYYKYDAQ